MRQLLPQHWHLATLIAVLVWLYWAVPANWPVRGDVASEYASMARQYIDVTGKPEDVAKVHFHRTTGFPFPYSSYRLLSDTESKLEYQSLTKLTLNVLLCSAVVFAVISTGQSVHKPSFRHVVYALLIYPAYYFTCHYLVPPFAEGMVSLGPKFHGFAFSILWWHRFVFFAPLLVFAALRFRSWQAANPQL
ncbi:hypothetical protein [Fuerstiella marisgermanici]|uniref:Uncharacterized protein n=1 Tax=Fuerstiella marisgermanici TaxID=1891926 RepID=A0A1P8WCX7_9PLAN|nr:hypothetical protein [Fuerstiella marisgermanici]APZ91912.1 hypothetical protein Fuma_01508 [Fuerstiella marisgermanici]